jgi:myo-inositol-1-phosphate synthase
MSACIAPPDGKLLVLTPGLGAVSTTFMAGVEAIRRGRARPIGSLTQLQTIRLGDRSDGRNPRIREVVPLAELDDLVFAAWDVSPDNAFEAAIRADVLSSVDLAPLSAFLAPIRPMAAVFDPAWVPRLRPVHVKRERTRRAQAEALRDDIRRAMAATGASRAVMVWCASTEVLGEPAACHQTIAAFEAALDADDPAISPSQLYAWAAIREGVPYANGAPNLSADIPALEQLARELGVPIAGKDFKTGQTLMKTIVAPGLKARMLGVEGWFSTNILGNRDGEVLDDPASFRAKEKTKAGVLDTILQPELYPELYDGLYHKVTIHYYPPRGDAKEGWDNIDLRGWMGYPMQIKLNFLCRDSILAAPVVLDVALFLDLAARAGRAGLQDWLGFYFKSPHVDRGQVVEHDVFLQHLRLKNTLRVMAGERPLTHLADGFAASPSAAGARP